MHKFDGLGTTHFTVKDDASGVTEALKLRVHHITLKILDGHVCAFYKEFMRDKTLLLADGKGWPVFLPEADLDLAHLETMPTFPLANLNETETRLQASDILYNNSYLQSLMRSQLATLLRLSALVDFRPASKCGRTVCLALKLSQMPMPPSSVGA